MNVVYVEEGFAVDGDGMLARDSTAVDGDGMLAIDSTAIYNVSIVCSI